MNAPDWNAEAKLIERDDMGSEMAYDFHERATGTLGELIAKVGAMSPHERARMVIDAGSQGTINVAQIVELAGRDDFPF
ncbi:hypothetical protein D3Y57_18425 [Sphingomonas paeninsulae]|jgi:hypothetical protein|uniref:Uncharacterized protein n=1 Tax=Sphingomonas paeninsulae TaxID=2319844 RepID=A0A494TDE2_SPHPE|nr:hypothetical protein [Sphingomonas paeninsulae]AYJ87529.1 hypothetical protein D3Y57_18425 [Sphingomonas paeninsulae]